MNRSESDNRVREPRAMLMPILLGVLVALVVLVTIGFAIGVIAGPTPNPSGQAGVDVEQP